MSRRVSHGISYEDGRGGGQEGGRLARIARLFAEFLRFGCFTFGGGWSIVAQMQRLYVEEQGTITNAELLDMTSIGRSIPGTMIGNIAMLYGFRMAGFWGGAACAFGMVLPPMLVLVAVAYFYTAFQNNPWVAAAMMGVRTAVVPIIAGALIKMAGGAFRFPPCVAVAAATFSLYLFAGVSSIWLVILGVACGFAVSEYYERKGRGGDDPA